MRNIIETVELIFIFKGNFHIKVMFTFVILPRFSLKRIQKGFDDV